MLASLQAPLFFGMIAACMAMLGLLAVRLKDSWSLRNAHLFGLAAAGMLCSLIFLHILPEALAMSQIGPVWLASGFFGGLFLSHAIQMVVREGHEGSLPGEAITPVLAIAIHSFVDGIIYAVTFTASVSSGVFAALSLILHEFPEAVICYAILRRFGVPARASFLYTFLAAALTTPLGVLAAGPFVNGLGQAGIGTLFALSAGLLLFVATGPLLSPLKDVAPVKGLLAVMSGVALALVIMNLPLNRGGHDPAMHEPHTHTHADLNRPMSFHINNGSPQCAC